MFQLFKILNPIWYYNLDSKLDNSPYWVDYRKLSIDIKKIVHYSDDYEEEYPSLFDASYQLWNQGFMPTDDEYSFKKPISMSFSIHDQYVFARRFFKPIWVYYALFIRLISFNNPFKELNAFFSTVNIKMLKRDRGFYKYPEFEDFDSNLVRKKVSISIVIPTLNRYEYLHNALSDLESQTYKNFEVIIIDQSDNFDLDFYKNYSFKIVLLRQKEKMLWQARNKAIKTSNSDYVLLFDDDSRVNPNWIINHLKCLDFFNVDVSAGASKSTVGAPIPIHYDYFRWGDQFDTGNAMLKKEIFKRCGLFDRQFEKMRMGDGEYGARIFLKGYRIVNNPKAYRIHLKSPTGGLRLHGSWDGMRPTSIFSPRPIPSVLYLIKKYWGKKAAINNLLITIPFSLSPYHMKGKKSGYILSLIFFTLFSPIIFFQVIRSWYIAKKMLEEGEKVEFI